MTPPSAAPRPIKLVHLITGLDTGGAETVLLRLVSRLDRARFDSVVVSLTGEGALGPRVRAAGVAVHTLGMRRGVPSPAAFVRLVRLLRRERPDVLQCWLYHADLAGLLAGRMAGVPAIAWNIRSADPRTRNGSDGPTPVLRALRALSRWPDAVVVNSRAGWHHHAELGYRPRQWRLIGNGVDVDVFRPSPAARAAARAELGIAPDAPVVGMVARFDPAKDHGTFFRAAARLRAARPDAVFVLAGTDVDPRNEAIRGWITEGGLDGRVRLLGPRADLPGLYPAFDVATLSSRTEGFPNVVVEAMACGVPAVVTDAGDAAEIVGDTGAVVPRGDAAALAAAWDGLLARSPAERADLGAAARERVAAHFSLAAMLRSYEDLWTRLAGRAPAAPRAAADAHAAPVPAGTAP